MADDVYVIDILATGGASVTVTDDGSGSDWLSIQGSYADYNTISLAWWVVGGQSVQASGIYFNPSGSRLTVNGLIENVRGSLTADWITGNEVANRIYGDQTATGPGGNDTISSADGNDSVWGGLGNDSINAAEGDDLVYGGQGNDTITGDAGLDTIQGGAGADVMSGGSNVGDTLSYANSAQRVQVALTIGSTTTGYGGDAEGDQIYGFTDIIGTDFADRFDDTIKTNNGSNLNTWWGGGGFDRMFMGGGRDVAYGGADGDLILGEADNDKIYGGAGGDTLFGGTGTDSLFGGADGDNFRFDKLNESTLAQRDRINDFVQGSDKVELQWMDIDPGTAGQQTFTFINGQRFHGVAGELRFKAVTGGVQLLGDVDGDGAADLSIYIVGLSSFLFGDLLL